ncbi:MAG TPA: YbjQ family protein [Clostridiales bacterium]|nr:YbjQ family protein [Clostridiales bacterium]
MLLTTCDQIPGKEYTVLGFVMGSFVNSKNIAKDIGAGLKSLVGGELKSYTKLMEDSRLEALRKMVTEAEKLNADAVVTVRLSSSSIMDGAAELLAYGTAVKFNAR